MALTITSTVKLNSGHDMNLFGLGTWRSGPGQVKSAVESALKLGYRHIDGAYAYENHKEVGEGIKASGVPREEIFVTTKLWCTHLRPEAAPVMLDKILTDLGLDYVDQLLIHWPVAFVRDEHELHPKDKDGNVAIDEEVNLMDTWKVMEGFVKDGKARTIGVSNCDVAQLKEFMANSTIKPATNQIEVNPYFLNKEVEDFCKEQGIHIVAYSPLGNHDPNKPHLPNALQDPVLLDLAKKHSKSPAQVIIRWHMQQGRTVIPKSVTPSRIAENADIFDFELSADDLKAIDDLGARNYRICNPKYAPHGGLVWPADTTAFE